MGKTANYNLPFPEETAKANVPLDIQNLAEAAETALENKVNSEIGKRLMTDAEGKKLASLENYDDTELNKKIEEQAEQIAQLEKEKNQLLKDHKPIPFNSSSNHLVDTGELPMPISINGGIEQDSRVGYNLLDVRGFVVKETNAQVTLDVTENGELIINGTSGNGGNDIRVSSNEPLFSLPAGDYIFDYKTTENTGEKFNTEINVDGVGTYLLVKRLSDAAKYKQFNITEELDVYMVNIHLKPNTTYTNYIIRPMIYSGTEVKDFEQYGAMPSLDFPSEVKGVSGHYDNVIENKNIFDYITDESKIWVTSINGTKIIGTKLSEFSKIKLLYQNNGYYINSYDNSGYTWFSIEVKLKKNTTYSFSCSSSHYTLTKVIAFKEKTLVSNLTGTQVGVTKDNETKCVFNSGDYETYLISFYPKETGIHWYDIQVEEGAEVTDYTEHQEQLLPIDIPTGTVLYSGKAYKENGKWYRKVEYFRERITTLKSISSTEDTNKRRFFSNLSKTSLACDTSENLNKAYMNRYKLIRKGNTYKSIVGFTINIDNTLSIYDEKYNDITEYGNNDSLKQAYETYLAENETYIVYPLAEPYAEEITDTTLIEQLEALEKAHSYYEVTNINSYRPTEDVAEMKLSGNALMSNDIRMSKIENAILSIGGNV